MKAMKSFKSKSSFQLKQFLFTLLCTLYDLFFIFFSKLAPKYSYVLPSHTLAMTNIENFEQTLGSHARVSHCTNSEYLSSSWPRKRAVLP